MHVAMAHWGAKRETMMAKRRKLIILSLDTAISIEQPGQMKEVLCAREGGGGAQIARMALRKKLETPIKPQSGKEARIKRID